MSTGKVYDNSSYKTDVLLVGSSSPDCRNCLGLRSYKPHQCDKVAHHNEDCRQLLLIKKLQLHI